MGGSQSRKRKKKRRILSWLKRRNAKAEEHLKSAQELMSHEVKLLILGTGDSGKSTFIKQIQILYKDGFSDAEKRIYSNVIRFNVVTHAKQLISACFELGINLKIENEALSEEFIESASIEKGQLEPDMVEDIIRLWSDPALKEAYDRRSEFQLPDSASYFLDNVSRISETEYIPTDTDVLSCRIATVGVKVLHFEIEGIPWRIVDVGGQRSERRKWIHQFDDVTSVIYVVAISEYDQRLYEDETVNRMHESLTLFEKTLNNDFFKAKNCVVLFNKYDIFEEKLQNHSINTCFPDYDGLEEIESIKEFIRNKFYSVADNSERNLYSDFTCGTKTEDIKAIFDSVIQSVDNQLKRISGL